MGEVEQLARELCQKSGTHPDTCTFGAGSISTDANGKTTSTMSCSRYAWEDFKWRAIEIISARAEGRNAGFEAGLEAAAEMAEEIAVKCDGNPIAITFRAFGGNLRDKALRSRARDLVSGEGAKP